MSIVDTADQMLRPLVSGWKGKIANARKSKQAFTDIGDQCMQFYCGATDFMWTETYMSRFVGAKLTPQFKLTIAKAFELVALYIPSLAWEWPYRHVKAISRGQPDVSLITDDPEEQQALLEEDARRNRRIEARAWLLSRYQNYTPNEQPGGGLQEHMERAVTDSLIKGMGCLWPEDYRHRGSNSTLTGCFYDSIDNLFIDPDTEKFSGTLDDAWWIAREVIEPVWKVERDRGYPAGTLQGNMTSGNADGEMLADRNANWNYQVGKTHDLLRYFKIWSRAGIGYRLADMDPDLYQDLNREAGDFAYLEIADTIDHPLNLSLKLVMNGSRSQVERAMRWPVPFWTDDRWPVCILDYYKRDRSPWSIAPMSQGLGELIALNVLMSAWLQSVWDGRLDLYACATSAIEKLKTVLTSQTYPAIVEVADMSGEKIDEILKIVQKPGEKLDIIKAMDMLIAMFERRTGINDLMQGFNPDGAQMRSAEEAKMKGQKVDVRPAYMRRKVAEWQKECARAERLLARYKVKANDVKGIFSPIGQVLWKQEVSDVSPEEILLETDVTITTEDLQKPDHDKERSNLQELGQILIPELSKHASETGETAPLNAYIHAVGDIMQIDTSPWEMSERKPPPEAMEQQQRLAQLEEAKLQADVEKTQMDAQVKMAQLGKSQADVEAKQMDMQLTEAERAMSMQADQEQTAQQLALDQERHQQELSQDQQRHLLELAQERQKFLLNFAQEARMGEQKIQTAQLLARAKAIAAARKPAAKPGTKK